MLTLNQRDGFLVSVCCLRSWFTPDARALAGAQRAKTEKAMVFSVGRNADGRLRVFVLGNEPDNAIHYITQNSPGSSSAWTWANPSLGNGGVMTNAAVGVNTDGRLEVFTIHTDNAIWHDWQLSPGSDSWSGWYSLGGSFVGFYRDSPP